MKTAVRIERVFGIVLFLAVGATLATNVEADCYRYISGPSLEPNIKDACVQELNVSPIFVRLTEDGYDLLVPTPTQDTTAMAYKRASAAVQWLSAPTNLASTQGVVESMLSADFQQLQLGVSWIEQINYTLASWLNTSGATAAISSMANTSYQPNWGTSCDQIPICTACQFYICPPGDLCRCFGAVGPDCCVIGKRLALLD